MAEQNRFNMKKNNLIRFVQSLVLLPVMTVSLSGISNTGIPQNILVKKVNIEANGAVVLSPTTTPEVDPHAKVLQAEADAIDAYFASHDMPLEGMGMKMAIEADNNDIDWRLLPAIAARESTGGRNACIKVKNNPFGWGSCKIGFKSMDDAIETLAANLGGNNPKTALHYDNKTTKQILHAYNPPSIVPRYAEQVMSIMNNIGDADISSTLAIANI